MHMNRFARHFLISILAPRVPLSPRRAEGDIILSPSRARGLQKDYSVGSLNAEALAANVCDIQY